MNFICQKCTLKIQGNQLKVECSVCQLSFHGNCMNMTSTDVKYLVDSNDKWSCPQCINASKRKKSTTDVSAQSTATGSNEPLTVAHFNALLAELRLIRDAQDEIKSVQTELKASVDGCSALIADHSAQLSEHQDSILRLRNDIADIRQSQGALDARVTGLLPATCNSGPDLTNMEECIVEAAERMRRSCNLMIFNVPEDIGPSGMGQADRDKHTVTEILESMSVALDGSTVNPVRLGKKRAGSSPSSHRPIKIVLNDKHTVDTVLKKSKVLATNSRYKDVRLSRDRTPKEIDYYNRLKDQMNDRIRNGEESLRIRHVKGVPKIVSLNL